MCSLPFPYPALGMNFRVFRRTDREATPPGDLAPPGSFLEGGSKVWSAELSYRVVILHLRIVKEVGGLIRESLC